MYNSFIVLCDIPFPVIPGYSRPQCGAITVQGAKRAWSEARASNPQRRGKLQPIGTGRRLTRTAGAYYLVASARTFAHGRAKRLAEHGDSPLQCGSAEKIVY